MVAVSNAGGGNDDGQLGIGSFVSSTIHDTPQGAVNFGSSNGVALTAVQMDSSANFSCAVLDNGSLKCWGNNDAGQLGIGSDTRQHTPQLVNLGTGKTAKQVVTGSDYTCAILNDDTVKCWGGYGDAAILGYGRNLDDGSAPPTTDTLDFGEDDEEQPKTAKQISAGTGHTCSILNDDSLVCWGLNGYGQLGVGNNDDQNTPQVVNLGQKTAKYVECGIDETCAILNDDSMVCWGRNNYGQLGYGDTTQRTSPPTTAVDLGTGRTVRQVVIKKGSGTQNVCALLDDHTVKCWGRHVNGSLGAGAGTFNWGDGNNSEGESEMGDNLPVVELL